MICRFNFGHINEQDYVQLLPTTDLDIALPEFVIARDQSLASLPAPLPPALLLQLFINSSRGNSSSSADDLNGPTARSMSGVLDGTNPSASVTDATSSDAQLYPLVEKYGPVIVGLLAGNIVLGVVLCVFGLFVCLDIVRSGARTRTVAPTYVPVRYKDAEAAEEGEMQYHD